LIKHLANEMEVGQLGSAACVLPNLSAAGWVGGKKSSRGGLVVELGERFESRSVEPCAVKHDHQRHGLGGVER